MRALSLILIVAALAALAYDALAAGGFRLHALGEVWFTLHPASLQQLQPAIERHVAVWLWDPLILTLLQWPAAAVAGGLGLALLFLSKIARRTSEF
jgi:hypothetical protein